MTRSFRSSVAIGVLATIGMLAASGCNGGDKPKYTTPNSTPSTASAAEAAAAAATAPPPGTKSATMNNGQSGRSAPNTEN